MCQFKKRPIQNSSQTQEVNQQPDTQHTTCSLSCGPCQSVEMEVCGTFRQHFPTAETPYDLKFLLTLNCSN